MQFTVKLVHTDTANFVKVVFSSGLQISTYPAASWENTLSLNECLQLCSTSSYDLITERLALLTIPFMQNASRRI